MVRSTSHVRGAAAARPCLPTLLLLTLGLAWLAGCGDGAGSGSKGRSSASSDATGPRPNVVLVTLDTTRADRLGCYGHAAAATPGIDDVAAGGARLTRAYAPTALTLPSHASLLTGTQPPEHGLRDNGRAALGPDVSAMAQVFRRHGYRTGAVLASRVLDRSFGLDRGFDVYLDRFRDREALARRASEVADEALTWLAEEPAGLETTRPFFLWLHFYDPHAAYQAPEPFASRHEPYDAEIAFVDAELRRVLQSVDARGAAGEETLVCVTADHGEALGEHGESTHGIFVYESTQRIPLVLSWPGVIPEGRVIDRPVSLVDIFPTLLQLLDWPVPGSVTGTSFADALLGERAQDGSPPVYLESEYSRLNFGWSALRGVVTERFKYIHSAEPELYDLERDPEESRNLAPTDPERTAELAGLFEDMTRSMRPLATAVGATDASLVESFEGLGYAQGNATLSEDADPFAGRAPQGMIDVLERYHRAASLKDTGRYADMIPDLEVCVRECPEGAAFRTVLGICYREVGRPADGRLQFEAALQHDPGYEHARQNLAELQFEANQLEEARANFARVVAANPGNERSLLGLAGVSVALERYDEALKLYETLAERRPDDMGMGLTQAYLLRQLGRGLDMKRTLQELVERFPGEHSIALYLAWELSTHPDADVRDGERALALCEPVCPDGGCPDADTVDTLAAAFAEVGRFEEARRHAQRALELARGAGNVELAQAIERRIEGYAAGRAHRE